MFRRISEENYLFVVGTSIILNESERNQSSPNYNKIYIENKDRKIMEKIEEKPNWKQWLPIYGIYQAAKDFINKRPSVMTEEKSNPWRFYGSVIYQATSFSAVVCGSLELLLK